METVVCATGLLLILLELHQHSYNDQVYNRKKMFTYQLEGNWTLFKNTANNVCSEYLFMVDIYKKENCSLLVQT